MAGVQRCLKQGALRPLLPDTVLQRCSYTVNERAVEGKKAASHLKAIQPQQKKRKENTRGSKGTTIITAAAATEAATAACLVGAIEVRTIKRGEASRQRHTMGIQGLLQSLRSVTDDVSIEEYSGLKVAVDAMCW